MHQPDDHRALGEHDVEGLVDKPRRAQERVQQAVVAQHHHPAIGAGDDAHEQRRDHDDHQQAAPLRRCLRDGERQCHTESRAQQRRKGGDPDRAQQDAGIEPLQEQPRIVGERQLGRQLDLAADRGIEAEDDDVAERNEQAEAHDHERGNEQERRGAGPNGRPPQARRGLGSLQRIVEEAGGCLAHDRAVLPEFSTHPAFFQISIRSAAGLTCPK